MRLYRHWREHRIVCARRDAATGPDPEIGFFLFFLPYTMLYNWAYDSLRERVIKRRLENRCA